MSEDRMNQGLEVRGVTVAYGDAAPAVTGASLGVACGEEKKDIITGALKGKYIDVLITDRSAALAILSEK